VVSNTSPTSGSAAINANNTITYKPNTGFVGGDTFQYTISDGHGGHATATVHVTVLSTIKSITTHLSSSTVFLTGPPVTDSAVLT
jgi:hypothetical protein